MRDAKDWNDSDHLEAMNCLIDGYWKPVFYFIRARGYPVHQAEDLTQEFFHNVLHRNWIRPADPQRGRFRNFLLAILVRFLSDQSLERINKQTGFERELVSITTLIHDHDRTFEPPDNSTPEKIFMKQWAEAVIRNVRRGLKTWCDKQGRPNWYEIFQAVHFPTDGQDKMSQQALADQLGISRDQVRYGLKEAESQFSRLLRAEVADQVDNQTDTDDEIDDLYGFLGGETD